MRTVGSASNALVLRILLRIVSATRALVMSETMKLSEFIQETCPTPTAPANSITVAIIIACFIVKDLEDTDVAKLFATSFAPEFD